MSIYTPLTAWINRQAPIPQRFINDQTIDAYSSPWEGWVGIEERLPVHEVLKAPWLAYDEIRTRTQAYLLKASKIINGLEGGWLDSEEREMILGALGPPPPPCLPLYLISVGDEEREELLYIGKTTTANRFTNGHHVFTALHAPEYATKKKFIYRCCIVFYLSEERIALEWVEPTELAREILDSAEAQLIYNLQPPLNRARKERLEARKPITLHIQNFTTSKLLNDHFIWA